MPKPVKGRRSEAGAKAPTARRGLLAALPEWLRSKAAAVRRAATAPEDIVMRDVAVLGGLLSAYVEEFDRQRSLAAEVEAQRQELLLQADAMRDAKKAAVLRVKAAKCAAKRPDWEGLVRAVTQLVEARRKGAATVHELNPRQVDSVHVDIVGIATGEDAEQTPCMWGGAPSEGGVTTFPVPPGLEDVVQ